MFDLDNIPLDDKATYDLICDAKTIGCFQAESHLVQSFCKKIQPRNIQELSDVIGIVRPGALLSAQDYIDIKFGKKEPELLDERLGEILKDSNFILLYQEQLLRIAQEIAGYSESDADREIRKPVGKKHMDKLKSVGPEFIKRCIDNGMKKDSAEQLWDIIVKSGSYLFNLSHSISYSCNFYRSAFLKTHYPTIFFWSCLKASYMKQKPLEEITRLFYDMKDFGINLTPPSIKNPSIGFEIVDKNTISFGFSAIKGVGDNCKTAINELQKAESWKEALYIILDKKIAKNKVEAFAKSGVFDCYGVSRNKMLFDYDLVKTLSASQLKILMKNAEFWKNGDDSDLINSIYMIFEENKRLKVTDKLQEALDKYNKNMKVSDSNVAKDIWEREYLGVNLTASRVDDIFDEDVNSDCAMVNSMINGEACFIGVLESMNKIKTRKSNEDMAFIDITDVSGKVSGVVVFSKVFKKAYYENFLLRDVGNETLKIYGFKKDDSFIAKEIVSV